jgi:serine/threonine protein kinase
MYKSFKGRIGFPKVFCHGFQSDYRVIGFALLGPNLVDLLRYCSSRFSMKMTLMLMDQLLRRIECLHATGYLHRDIRPEHFLLGTGKRGIVVYVTDLGLATYRRVRDESIQPCDPTKAPQPSLIGTCRFASVSGHFKSMWVSVATLLSELTH